MARTKPLEEDKRFKFARGVLDHIIAQYDPEVATEQGKNPAAVALGKRGGAGRPRTRQEALRAKVQNYRQEEGKSTLGQVKASYIWRNTKVKSHVTDLTQNPFTPQRKL